jgi:hypothetical protein
VIVKKPDPCGDETTCRPDALAINSDNDPYYETDENVFQHPTAWWATAAFRRVGGAEDMLLFLDRAAFEKRPAWRLPALQRLLMALMLPLAILGAIIWPLLARRRTGESVSERNSRRVVHLCATFGLLMLIALGLFLRIYAVDDIQMDYGIRLEALILMASADALKIAALIVTAVTIFALLRGYWGGMGRLFTVLLSISMLHSAWLLQLSNVTLLNYIGA